MVKLYNETTGALLGTISAEEFAFLQANLEEEGLEDRDYWVDLDTVEMLAARGGPAHLIQLLQAAVGTNEEGIDIAFEQEVAPK